MKNKIKLFGNITRTTGFIAIVAVMGFSMAACWMSGGEGETFLKVVNQNDNPITSVYVDCFDFEGIDNSAYGRMGTGAWRRHLFFNNVNIPKGSSQTFPFLISGYSARPDVTVWTERGVSGLAVLGQAGILSRKGRTTTVTLGADGELR